MVDRFDYVGGSYPMAIKPNGEYVEYEDYAALEARVAELEKDAARYRWLQDGGINELPIVTRNGDDYMSIGSYLDGDIDVLMAMNES